MTLLEHFRLSPRWLILLVAVAALAVTTVALVPHDEGNSDDIHCLVCKAGHQPLTELSAELVAEPPIAVISALATYQVELKRGVADAPVSPRAPPA